MSIVHLVQNELRIWKHAWQQIESFLDRIDEAHDNDEEHAGVMRGLLRVAAAISEERRRRDGGGLSVPLELEQHERHGQGLALALQLLGEMSSLRERLPGAYDLEIAVTPPYISRELDDPSKKPDDATATWHIAPLVYVELPEQTTIFSYFDESSHKSVKVAFPSYGFDAHPLLVDITSSDAPGFFNLYRRMIATGDGGASPLGWPMRWTELCASRPIPASSKAGSIETLRSEAVSSAASRQQLVKALKEAAAAADSGSKAMAKAAKDLAKADLGPDLTVGAISKGATAMGARHAAWKALHDKIAAGAPPFAPAILQSLEQTKEDSATAALYGQVASVLDEAVGARLAYPDGTLRVLRVMESSFVLHWQARVVWFKMREARYLDRLLERRLVAQFLDGLRLVYAYQPTGLGWSATLDPAAPAPLSSTSLQLAPRAAGDPPRDLTALVPGQVAVIDGPRRTLAVILGDDSRKAKRTPTATAAEQIERLKIAPLRISMARSPRPAGIPGMLTEATIGEGPVWIDDADIRRGGVSGYPEHDGLVEQLVALWSQLCLVLGSTKVMAKLAGARAGSSGDLPSDLDRQTLLPIVGELKPHDARLAVEIASLPPSLLPFDEKKPVVARPGELLLLRGADPDGALWQGVVEVLSIVRTSDLDADPPLPPLAARVCCDPPGDYLVIQVKDTTFPVTLTGVVLHRNFQGFGMPSLATAKLLPKEIDSSAETAADAGGAYRGPELSAACAVLASWMWEPS